MPSRSNSTIRRSVADDSEDEGSDGIHKHYSISANEATMVARVSEALRSNKIDNVKKAVMQEGFKIDEFKCKFGTLLHLAASFGTKTMFEDLVMAGISVNARSTDGSTVLHVASRLGRHDIVELLLELEDLDDTIRDYDGMTACELATSRQMISMFEYARNIYHLKKTREMHSLVHKGDSIGLERLFQSPRNQYILDINALDPFGDSPLHIAAKGNNLQMVAFCLRLGADPFLKNKKNKLPIELCKDEALKAILKEAPMVHSKAEIAPNPNIKLEGTMSKWANYAEGYKKRWFVLEDGLLSYYKSQAEYPVSCRGSVNVQFCRVIEHPSDKYRFEVVGLNNSIRFHLRAESIADAKKWVIAINEAKTANQNNKTTVTFPSPLINPTPTQKHPQTDNPVKNMIDECYMALSTSETLLLHLCDIAESTRGDEESALKRYIREETEFHKKLSRLLASIEDFEISKESEVLSLKRQLEALESTVHEYAKDNDRLEVMSKEHEGSIDSKSLDDQVPEEFYDVYEDQAAQVEEIAENGNQLNSPGYTTMSPRTCIPCDSTKMPPVNLWSILKGLIGKDVFRFPLPVNFSEPLSMLQRLAEDVEYAELLDKAAREKDPMLRIQFVSAFAVSCYSSTENRLTKPFNPLLGETFEYFDQNRSFKYIAEQVSHHPPISACHCEGKDWVYWSEVDVTNKFGGKSLDIRPEGWNHVIIKSTGDHYVWKKVQMSIYNLIIGKLWIDHYGTMIVENKANGKEKCVLEFKAHGWRGTNAKRVIGEAFDSSNKPLYMIDGHWNTALISRNLTSGKACDLWRRRPLPPNAEVMYMFTRFAMTLNQLDQDMIPYLCPTDSRFRPDQRAMEEGRWEEANELKVKLEEKQRTTRKLLESQPGFEYKPRWFKQELCKETNEPQWTFIGGYWEARKQANWSRVEGIPRIYL